MSDPAGNRNITAGVLAAVMCVAIAAISVASGMVSDRFAVAIVCGAAILCLSSFFPDKKLFYLAILAFVLPVNATKRLIIVDSGYGLLDSVALSLTDITLIILMAIWVCRKITHRDTAKARFLTFISVPLCVMFLAGVLSLINAKDMPRGLCEMFRMLKALVLYFYVVNNVRSKREVKVVCITLAIGVVFQCAIAMVQYISQQSLGLIYIGEAGRAVSSFAGERVFVRAGGTMGHPNIFAYYLEFAIPLMLGMSFVRSQTVLRWCGVAGFAAGCVAMILSFSRGGWVASGIATMFALVIFLKRNFSERKFIIRSVAIIVLIASVGAVFSGKIMERVLSRDAGAAKTRLLQLEVAREVVKEHPIIGVGANNYVAVMEEYGDTPSRVSRNFKFPIHNVYMLYLAETGAIGLFAFIWLIVAIIVRGWKDIFGKSTDANFLGVGLLFGCIGYFIHISVDMNLLSSFPQFFFMAALFTVLCYSTRYGDEGVVKL